MGIVDRDDLAIMVDGVSYLPPSGIGDGQEANRDNAVLHVLTSLRTVGIFSCSLT
jgi:hypothetical protein